MGDWDVANFGVAHISVSRKTDGRTVRTKRPREPVRAHPIDGRCVRGGDGVELVTAPDADAVQDQQYKGTDWLVRRRDAHERRPSGRGRAVCTVAGAQGESSST
jgi:hypothetical protein